MDSVNTGKCINFFCVCHASISEVLRFPSSISTGNITTKAGKHHVRIGGQTNRAKMQLVASCFGCGGKGRRDWGEGLKREEPSKGL